MSAVNDEMPQGSVRSSDRVFYQSPARTQWRGQLIVRVADYHLLNVMVNSLLQRLTVSVLCPRFHSEAFKLSITGRAHPLGIAEN